VVVNKTLSIIGKKGSAPIFGGGGSGVAITLLSGASGSTIAGVVTTYWDIGILIRNASDCKIYDNIISLIKYNGIVLEGANAAHNLVYCNMFERNGVAINLTSSSNDSDVFQNILSSGGAGICLESDGNSVYANTISGNDVGINITNSNDNEFYHNNFEGNSVQLHISVSTGNTWDNGYPSGGNYWSDHTAIDVHGGPYQNETGSDGIVDTPYVVAGNDVDNYPLSKPFSLHNIGITKLVGSKTVVGQSYTLRISVKIQNLGMYDESFTLIVSANETVLDRVAVGVTMKKSVAFDLSLSTSKLTVGNYTLSVVTDNLPGETENSDNSFNCSVTVTIPGDLNGDFTVDIYDAIILANAYNSKPGGQYWNPNADINSDNIVDIYDAIILANHYNQHYP
jgi:parallel beta-helix repeat protein